MTCLDRAFLSAIFHVHTSGRWASVGREASTCTARLALRRIASPTISLMKLEKKCSGVRAGWRRSVFVTFRSPLNRFDPTWPTSPPRRSDRRAVRSAVIPGAEVTQNPSRSMNTRTCGLNLREYISAARRPRHPEGDRRRARHIACHRITDHASNRDRHRYLWDHRKRLWSGSTLGRRQSRHRFL